MRPLDKCVSALLLGLCLGGCAAYRPVPLASGAALLTADPLAAPLLTQAHPRLTTAAIDLSQALSELDVARIMLSISPELVALRARVQVAEAQLFAAGIVADPQLSLAFERASGAGLVNALGLSLASDLASLLTRGVRREAARASAQQVRHDVAWSEWLAINQVRTLVRRIGYLQRQQALLDAATDSARKLLALYRDNMQRGEARLDDVSLYQVGFIDAQDRALALTRMGKAARLQLNALLGLPPSTELALQTDQRLPSPASFDVAALARRALTSRLDLQALREGYAAQQANTLASVRLGWPLPQLALNRSRDTSNVWSTGLAATLTLPLWDRNRGAITVAQATRAQLRVEYQARVQQMLSDIAAQATDLQALAAQRDALAAELPELRAAASQLAAASQAGSVPLVTYETLRAALLERESNLLGLEQAHAEGLVALETAVGALLWKATP